MITLEDIEKATEKIITRGYEPPICIVSPVEYQKIMKGERCPNCGDTHPKKEKPQRSLSGARNDDYKMTD